MQNRILWGTLLFLGALALVVSASAFSGSAHVVVEGDYIAATPDLGVEQVLGGSFSSDPSNLTASDEWQAVNSLYEYGDLEVDGTTYLDGAVQLASTLTVSAESQLSTVVSGGSVLTSSTPNNTVLTAAQVCDNSVILMSPGLLALNVTLPATSTLYADCLNTNGDSKELVIRNTSSTVNTEMTLVAGTGLVSMATPSSTAGLGDVIGTSEQARLLFTRLGDAAGQISVETLLFADAD
jgi:hypothetical protein